LERQPLHEELLLAKSDEEKQRIADKYSHLLGDDREYVDVLLNFTGDGVMTIGVENSKFLTQLTKKVAFWWLIYYYTALGEKFFHFSTFIFDMIIGALFHF